MEICGKELICGDYIKVKYATGWIVDGIITGVRDHKAEINDLYWFDDYDEILEYKPKLKLGENKLTEGV